MRYLLDTNAWLRWFHRPEELSTVSRELLQREAIVGLSPMSVVEVAQKVHKGKLALPRPVRLWVHESMPGERVQLVPITSDIALRAYEWPEDFHGDPADRIIAASAAVHELILVTSDQQLLARTDLKTLSTC